MEGTSIKIYVSSCIVSNSLTTIGPLDFIHVSLSQHLASASANVLLGQPVLVCFNLVLASFMCWPEFLITRRGGEEYELRILGEKDEMISLRHICLFLDILPTL